MSYATKLQYAGSEPFEREDERLPYPIFEALSQDEQYTKLAQVRWLVDECESEMATDDAVPERVWDALLRGLDRGIEGAVDAYVSDWIASRTESWLDEWEIDEGIVAEACAAYDVSVEGVTA